MDCPMSETGPTLSSNGRFGDTPRPPQNCRSSSATMQSIRNLTLLLALAGAAGAASLASAQTREIAGRGDLLDRIAVVVNDGVVLQSQIDGQVTSLSHRLRDQGTQLPAPSALR